MAQHMKSQGELAHHSRARHAPGVFRLLHTGDVTGKKKKHRNAVKSQSEVGSPPSPPHPLQSKKKGEFSSLVQELKRYHDGSGSVSGRQQDSSKPYQHHISQGKRTDQRDPVDPVESNHQYSTSPLLHDVPIAVFCLLTPWKAQKLTFFTTSVVNKPAHFLLFLNVTRQVVLLKVFVLADE